MSLAAFTPRAMSSGIKLQGDALRHFLTASVVTGSRTHPGQIIDWGVLGGNAKVMLYTRPGENAQPIALTPGDLKTLQGPRLRAAKNFDEAKLTTLNPGFTYTGPYMNSNDQIAEKVAYEQADFVRRFNRVKEIQASQLLQLGIVTFTYPDATSATVDYGFSGDGATPGAAYNIQPAKSGTTRWNTTTGDPLSDLRTWARQIREYSNYDGQLMLIAGTEAVDALLANAKIQALLDNRRIMAGSLEPKAEMAFLGTIGGIEIWEYMMSYEAADGTRTAVWDSKSVVMCPKGDSERFSWEYAAVFEFPDKTAEFPREIETEWFSKIYRSEEPPVSQIIVETRPLAVCKDVRPIRKCVVVAAS